MARRVTEVRGVSAEVREHGDGEGTERFGSW